MTIDTTETMRHLAAIGSGNAVTVFAWLVAAGSPVTQEWLIAMTGLSDKTIAPVLVKLANLQYIVKTGQGWMVATARQGVLGEVLEALAPAPEQLPEPAQPAPAPGESEFPTQDGISDSGSYGVGVVLSNKDINTESYKHQQHHGGGVGNSDSPANLPAGDPDRGRARVALLRAGVWPNQVETILAGLRPERGLGDVLGWIAYCQDDASGVDKPAAIVAGKLKRGEWPSSAWIAPRICGVCRLIEGRCLCQDPAYHYPPDYDELAFEPPPAYDRDTWLANRWRCNVCYSHPCQCEALPDTQEEQEQ